MIAVFVTTPVLVLFAESLKGKLAFNDKQCQLLHLPALSHNYIMGNVPDDFPCLGDGVAGLQPCEAM